MITVPSTAKTLFMPRVIWLWLLLLLTPVVHAVELRDVRLWEGPEATRVVLDLEGGAEHKALMLANPDRLVIDIQGAHRAPGLKLDGLGRGVVKSVRSGRHDDSLRVVFDLAGPVSSNALKLEPSGQYGYRLVFDLTRLPAAATAPVPASPAAPKAPPRPPEPPPTLEAPPALITPALPDLAVLPPASKQALPRVLPTPPEPVPVTPPAPASAEPLPLARPEPRLAMSTKPIVIAIDAGHGGDDPGAKGVHGVLEKDVCLQIAKRLAKLFETAPGYKPVLTRRGDDFIALRQRTTIARKAQADLFISIHANSMPVTNTMRGTAVYVLSERGASSEHAKMLANLENSADLVGGVPLKTKDDDLASVLLDISQTAVREASFDLASRLLGSIAKTYALQKSEPQQAGFAVLKSPDIPSVLVETAFLSDEEDERLLANPEHQQAIAESLFNGVQSYFTAYRPQAQAASAEPEAVARPVSLKRKRKGKR